jgi:hypothetical protein
VDDAVSVRVVQRIGDPNGCAQGKRQRERTVLEAPGECRSVDMLHHQEDGGAVFTDVMEGADIRMRDACDGAGFVPEAFDSWIVGRDQLAREELDGDDPLESRIASPVHFTHSPGAER